MLALTTGVASGTVLALLERCHTPLLTSHRCSLRSTQLIALNDRFAVAKCHPPIGQLNASMASQRAARNGNTHRRTFHTPSDISTAIDSMLALPTRFWNGVTHRCPIGPMKSHAPGKFDLCIDSMSDLFAAAKCHPWIGQAPNARIDLVKGDWKTVSHTVGRYTHR